MDAYRTARQAGKSELIIKRSRFLSVCMPVPDEASAQAQLAAIQKQYWDASHNCYAYVLSEHAARHSDAGEPAGTAGIPILEVLHARRMQYTLVVVTRDVGGILLGASGLVRAYSRAAAQAVDAAGAVDMLLCRRAEITVPYGQLEKVSRLLLASGLSAEAGYTECVTLSVWVPIDRQAAFDESIAQVTDGQTHPQWYEQEFRISEIHK